MGCSRDIKALLGDESLVYCGPLLGVMSRSIVGDRFGCFKGF